MSFLRLLALALVFTFSAPALQADCGDDSNNKLQTSNCDMDADPAIGPTWQSNATLSHDTTDGFPPAAPAGSAEVAAVDLASGANFWAMNLSLYGTSSAPTCFPITFTGTEATAGIYLRQISGTASCSLTVNVYPGTNCSLGQVGTCTAGPVSATGAWSLLSCQLSNPSLNTAIGMTFAASCGPESSGFTVRNDNAFVIEGTGSVPVELQSFSVED